MTGLCPSAEHFSVAWISALPVERAAAEHVLDEQYDPLPAWCPASFVLGRIGGHQVVIGCPPAGYMGTTSAAVIATSMKSVFKHLQIRLLVGIGGGVPSPDNDIRLGDVVVSQPQAGFGGVVQYDFGKTGVDGYFKRTGFLNAPPKALLDTVSKLRVHLLLRKSSIWKHLTAFDSIEHFTRANAGPDILFQATSHHAHGSTCDNCDQDMVIHRPQRNDLTPAIHYGTIASGNQVVKDAIIRDQRSADLGGVLCFEMEAAGLMNDFSCLVIRGICDYADSHKTKSWQPYASATAAACAKEILVLTPLVYQRTPPSQTARSSVFLVPFARDKYFVDRGTVLSDLEAALQPADHTEHRRMAVVGLGGIGKSQIAIEYAYRAHDHSEPTSVFWIHASSAIRFRQGYQEIAERANLPGRNDPNVDILQLVIRWLSESIEPWLIILDNVDEGEVFFSTESGPAMESFLPQTPNGCILLTSRSSDIATTLVTGFGDVLEVDAMSEREALQLLASRISLDGFENDTRALIRALDCIPLAITHAAAYLKMRKRCTISSYLRLLQQNDETQSILLNNRRYALDLRRDNNHRDPILASWQITFHQIQNQCSRAIDLLALMSMYDCQGIPKDLLQQGLKVLPGGESIEFEDALDPLISFCLVKEQISYGFFGMHPLIQLSMRNWLDINHKRQHWLLQALCAMVNFCPDCFSPNWAVCQQLLPHARQLLRQPLPETGETLRHAEYSPDKYIFDTEHRQYIMSSVEMSFACWIQVSNDFGNYFLRTGQYSLSKPMLQDAVEVAEKEFGPEHHFTCMSIHNLAVLWRCLGKLHESEQMFRRVYRTRETALGSRHSRTLLCLTNLACTLCLLGKLNEAEMLYRNALEGQEEVIGGEHPYTLNTMTGLGQALTELGKYEEAEALQRQALERREIVLGGEHPAVLNSTYGLAMVLLCQGKPQEAERMFRQNLEASIEKLGLEHPDTLTTMCYFSTALNVQGKHREAEPFNLFTLEARQRLFEPDHPQTLISLSKLASTWYDLGRRAEGRQLMEECANLKLRVFGSDHPTTIHDRGVLELWDILSRIEGPSNEV